MRYISYAFALLSATRLATAQTLAPSPTESVGCEPHGDHWHCDGPRETSTTIWTEAISTTSSAPIAVTTADDHDHDHDEDHTDEPGTATLAPSPTESVGCEPHGDHWHCDGPASAISTSIAVTLTTTTTPAVGTISAASSSSSVFTAAAAVFTRGVEAYGLAGLAALAAVAI